MVMNKSGWLRIVEASIALMIIFGATLTFSQVDRVYQSEDVRDELSGLLKDITTNQTLREKIVNEDPDALTEMKKSLSTKINNQSYAFDLVICKLDTICQDFDIPSNPREVYVIERVVSGTIERYNPVRLRLAVVPRY